MLLEGGRWDGGERCFSNDTKCWGQGNERIISQVRSPEGRKSHGAHISSNGKQPYCLAPYREPFSLLQISRESKDTRVCDPTCLARAHSGIQLCNNDLAQVNMDVLVTALGRNANMREQPV